MSRVDTGPDASGRFILRMDSKTHAELRDAARRCGLSLNSYCVGKLAETCGLSGLRGPAAMVGRAVRLFGDHLVGVVVYGSWARGEATADSDVDSLIVLDHAVEIDRRLYRLWDDEPVIWDGRAVEPHFVHLPDPEESMAGLWAEVALDGIVLHDPSLRLSARLGRVRRDIAEGRIRRHTSHGQPYWVFSRVA